MSDSKNNSSNVEEKNINPDSVDKQSVTKRRSKKVISEISAEIESKVENDFVLIDRKCLPSQFQKIIRIKELLLRGGALTLKDAGEEVDLSLRTYHRHKNSVKLFFGKTEKNFINILFTIDNKKEPIARLLNKIAKYPVTTTAVNQGKPKDGLVHANFSVDITNLDVSREMFIDDLKDTKGVHEVEILEIIDFN